MRLLHRVHPHVPIWPFDPPPESGSLIVEIYTRIAARAAGRPRGQAKMRDLPALNDALLAVESQPHEGLSPDAHGADAILPPEIRRQSGREGVCQYGYISGAAERLKKKIPQQ